MKTSDVIALISVLIAVLSLALAVAQHRQATSRAESESERLARQRERLRNASSAATACAQAADAVVQRAKEGDVTIVELQNQVRSLRGHLTILAMHLQEEEERIKPSEVAQAFRSTRSTVT